MPAKSEAVRTGQHLQCGHCGTEVKMQRVGGGRMECCDAPLQACSDDRGEQVSGQARCSGCGNEAAIVRDGGGELECCNEGMERE